jgi:Glycosyl hydrolases family 35
MGDLTGRRRIADLEPLSPEGIAVLAEYPYYRAEPGAWADNLRALKDLGATVITAYVPWRLHELDPETDGERGYDFTGRTDPQRDVIGFCKLVQEAGLSAILKPGPFIHAEVRLGGLPERLTAFPSRLSAYGRTITDEGEPAPSAHTQEFTAAARQWLSAVRTEVLDLVAYPSGPVIGLQIGNEGLFSDLHKPIHLDDFSSAAVSVASQHLGRRVEVPHNAATREQWLRWSGVGTRGVLSSWRDVLGDRLPVAVNVPLPGLPGPGRLPETWLMRSSESIPSGVLVGGTSWSGNAMLSDQSLLALWLGMRFTRTDVVEENWGFTWTDDSYATPAVPVYHSLLGLALGSSTVSVYTACTTYHWAPQLGPDPVGVRLEGGNPEDFTPPYCPGAPLDESGVMHPNAAALRLLTTFTQWFGPALRSAVSEPDAFLMVDPVAVTDSAWPTDPGPGSAPLSVAAAAGLRWMVQEGVEVDIVRPNDVKIRHQARTWLVVSGLAMDRQTQHRLVDVLAANGRCVVVGPLPRRDELGEPCDVLAQALSSSPAGCHIPVSDMQASDAVTAVYAVLTEPTEHPTSLDPTLLRLVRTTPETGTTVLYLFSRSDVVQEYSGQVAGVEIATSVAPRGVVVLVLVGETLQGLLFNRGSSEPYGTFTPFLAVGEELVPLEYGGDLAGRRGPDGWEFSVP